MLEMTTRLLACFALTLTTACASKEGDGSKPAAKVTISSVQMINDCPDEENAAPAAAASMERSADVGPGDSFEQPCTQSAMQLAVDSDVEGPFVVDAVRLLSPEGKPLATLQPRRPSKWVDGAYKPWDERVAKDTDLKASYKLSIPEWHEVDEKLGGGSSVGKMFLLEVDVSVNGQKQTIRSSSFPREEDHVIVT
jgi:hypothetical protein